MVEAVSLLVSSDFGALLERDWIEDFAIQFIQTSIEPIDCKLLVLPDIESIRFAEVSRLEDGRGHLINLDVPLREQVGDADVLLVIFEVLNDGSFKLAAATWQNLEARHSFARPSGLT